MKIPKDVVIFMHFGWSSATLVLLAALAGKYLDAKFETTPKILLALILFSFLSSGVLFYSMVKKIQNKS